MGHLAGYYPKCKVQRLARTVGRCVGTVSQLPVRDGAIDKLHIIIPPTPIHTPAFVNKGAAVAILCKERDKHAKRGKEREVGSTHKNAKTNVQFLVWGKISKASLKDF